MTTLNNPFIGIPPEMVSFVERPFIQAGVSPEEIKLIKGGDQSALKAAVEKMQRAYMAGLSKIAAESGADAAARLHGVAQEISQGANPLEAVKGLKS
jgi:hypothetical protein